MARRAGRNGRIYLDVAGGGNASPLPFVAKWSVNFTTDKYEVTAMGDSTKIYVAGLADAQGDWSGFGDDATAQSYTAAVDGIARKFYLYWDLTNTPGRYFFGTIFPDLKVDSDVNGVIAMSASWNAATSIFEVG
jgi:hypothetical protein